MIALLNCKSIVESTKKAFLVAIVLGFLIAPTVYGIFAKAQSSSPGTSSEKVLGISQSQNPEPTPSLASTPSPIPTSSPTPSSPFIPTPSSSPILSPSPSPAPSSSLAVSPVSSPSPSPIPSSSPSPTPIPTPSAINVEINVVYTGASDRSVDSYSTSLSESQTAWDVVENVIGIENLQYTDYGGDLGIFITGINGVVPTGNQFWEFRVNGQSSLVGVSSYVCNNGDSLDFVITTF